MHDYAAALQAVQNEASMLYNAVRSIVQMDATRTGMNPKVIEILSERAEAFHKAMYGDY